MPEYTVSDYLLDRLVEMGVDRIFGVPGDFTLRLLDHVVDHPGLVWTGCTNELNAGYAADGYGRMRGLGALMTTFGVGELSAINAITGSYAEHVPVVHIVGSPSTDTQTAQRIVHHSLGDGVFTHFLDMHRSITCARAALTRETATTEVDRVLVAARDARLPAYLLLPSDVGEAPAQPPANRLPGPVDPTDEETLDEFADAAARLVRKASATSDISVLAGVLVHRFGTVAELTELINQGPLPHATSVWGKSLVDEANPAYLGIYQGGSSEPGARKAIEDAPVLIIAGVEFTDLNSGFFTQQITRSRTIELGPTSASVGSATFAPLSLTAALRTLASIVAQVPRGEVRPSPAPTLAAGTEPTAELTQGSLWGQVAGYLRPGDVVMADQGTSFYGMATARLPSGVTFLGQPLWASIGYSLPGLLGACLAAPGRRGILLVGDGAAQMTVQELSSFLRAGLAPTVIVVDNRGYTVERAIHGPEQAYNDIAEWDWTGLPALLAPGTASNSFRVTTNGALSEALACASSDADRLTLVQAVVPRLDTPPLLADLARAAARANAPRGGPLVEDGA